MKIWVQNPAKTSRKPLTVHDHLLSPLVTLSTPLCSLFLGTKEALCCGWEVKHGTRFCPFKQMGNGNMADDGTADNELKVMLEISDRRGNFPLPSRGSHSVTPLSGHASTCFLLFSLFDRWSVRRSSDLGFLPRSWVPRQNSHYRWNYRVQCRSALRLKEV